MERTERTAFGIALVGHVALIVALKFLLDQSHALTPPPSMEVSFVEESSTVSSAPSSEPSAAPAAGDEVGPAEEASGADASVPEPEPQQAVPEPTPPRPETTDRRRADLTRSPVVNRPLPRPPVQSAQPRPNPPRPQQQPQARPAPQRQGTAPRSRSFDPRALDRSLRSGAGSEGASPRPSAALTGAERQSLSRNISALIQPCAANARPPNSFARTISVDLRVTVNPNGGYVSHQLVSRSGTNESNEDYVPGVVDVAVRAVRACQGRLATLPADQYGVAGGWRTFRYRFRFP